MIAIDDIQWGVFKLTDIFDIVDGYYNKKPEGNDGNIPFLGATQYNNGITAFYKEEDIKRYNKTGEKTSKDYYKRIFNGNCIAVTNNGSVGNAYYQKNKFTCSHDVTPLYLKGYKLNRQLALFLIQCLTNAGKNFEYAKKWRPKRMRKSKLMLPLDSESKPNWKFMEKYIKKEEKKQLSLLKKYLEKKVLHNLIVTSSFKNIEWKEFNFDEIFSLKHKNLKIEENLKENYLDIFYKTYTLKISSDTNIFSFILPFLEKINEKFNLKENIYNSNLKKEKFKLPINENGNVNYLFMEKMIKEYNKNFLNFINNHRKEKKIFSTEEWGPFFLEDISQINSGKDIYAKERADGKIPYITSTSLTNGIGYFVSNKNTTYSSNKISINRNGSVGYAFYHPYKALYSNDTRNIQIKNISSYTQRFIANQITKQKEKYGYGYKMGTGRIKRQMIMLPKTLCGNPDYEYMDTFMRILENKILINYLKIKDKEL